MRRRAGVLRIAAIAIGISATVAGADGGSEAYAPILTLDEAVDLALLNNRGVKNAGLEVAKAADDVEAMKARRFPQIDVGVYESYHFTDESFTFPAGAFGDFPATGPIPPNETKIESARDFSTLVTARVALPLSQQYRIGLGVDQREVAEDLATEQLRSKRQGTAKNVKDLYFSILRSEASLDATQASVTYLASLSNVVSRYVQEQRVLRADSLEVQTELARARQRAAKERDSIANQREQMNILLGRPIGTPFQLRDLPGPARTAVDPLSAEADALAQRPVIKDAKLKAEHAELGVAIKKSEYIPDVSIEARYTSPFGAKFIPKNLGTIGLFARWDVWDWGKRSHEIAAQNLAVQQAQNQVREAQEKVRADVNAKLRALQRADEQLPVAQLAEETAREKLRVAENKYHQQSAIIEDVLSAEADLARAKRDVEEAKLGAWKSWTDLQKAMGEE